MQRTRRVIGPGRPRDVELHPVVRGSADGHASSVLMALYGRDVSVVGWTPMEHHRLVRDLVAAQATAREATGTYLGIKRYPSDEQPRLLAALEAADERGYDVFADVLDEMCAAPQLQRQVAADVAAVAFSSRYAARFVADQGAGRPLAPEPSEQPDQRLAHILRGVEDTTAHLDEVLAARQAAAAARVGLPAWDLHDEHAWSRATERRPDAVDLVKQELSQVLRPWLRHVADLPALTDDEARAARAGLDAWAASIP